MKQHSKILLSMSGLWFLVPATVVSQHGHEEKLGKVNFPVTCSAEAQREFVRGVALLHSFVYEEAEGAFSRVADADPGCAMAYWGKAMCYYRPIWEPPSAEMLQKGKEAAQKAKSLGAKTERERDYIDAIAAFYKDHETLDHRTRALAYANAMEEIYKKYPDDAEAAIFCALSLLSRPLTPPTDKAYANQKKAGEILEKILATYPEHPGLVHYIIHSYDYPALAGKALPAARTYARIAPSAPHALHMPSHIFTRLGLWEESAKTNAASASAAKSLAERIGIGARDELHAMDYMTYAYLQLGRDDDARRQLGNAEKIPASEKDDWASAYAHAAIPARFAVERVKWSEAAKLAPKPTRYPYGEAITYFARALGAARSGDTAAAHEAVEKLQSLREAMEGTKMAYNWADQIEIQRRAAAGWLAWLEGRNQEAVELLRSAADLEDASEKDPVTPGPIVPARELLGELLLELNRPAEALEEFSASLRISPNRARGLFSAARAADLSGNKKLAREFYAKFTKLWSGAAKDKPELKIATTYLEKR